MILSMLYDVNFIIGLLITLVLVTVVAFYFSQRIEDQSEKISAVSVVVQAIAGELHELRHRVGIGNVNVMSSGPVGGGIGQRTVEEPAIELSEYNNIDLIDVSDDEESDDDNDERGNVKSIHIGGSCENDITLNEVECDDSGSESDSESDDSDDSDDSEDSEESDDSDSESDVEPASPDAELILETDLQTICGDISVAEEDICATLNILEELEELGEISEAEGRAITKTVNVSLEEEVVDYKKMSLSKLRNIVVEKHLSQDASKLKKGELFKLLGVEQ
jgi:hypothetical protein